MIARRVLASLALAALVAAGATACGSDGSNGADVPPEAAPGSTTSTSGGTADGEGRRIIPLDGDIAEIVFALGLGDEVVATDLSATHPQAASDLPKIGFERALNAEPILEFEPTIVIGTDAAGPQETLDQIERIGVPVTIIEREYSPSAPASKIRQVADALGVPDAGAALATTVQRQIDEAAVEAPADTEPTRVVALYLRGENLQFVLGTRSGIHWIIEAAGAHDVADGLGVTETAPITAESILAAAPDVILVPESGLASAGGVEALLAVPGIAETPAGRTGAILAYDDQLMLGNGPRTGVFLAQLVTDLRALDATRPQPTDGP